MAADLDAQSAAWVEKLPESLSIAPAPGLRVVHGSPESAVEGLGPWTSDETLERHLDGLVERTLVCGHTHRPMIREVGAGIIVNIGSVGLPFNEDPRAQYAIFSYVDGVWHPQLAAVEYDRRETLKSYVATGFWAQGGVTAQLLALEIVHSRPFLVPFLVWARNEQCPPHTCNVDRFLAQTGHNGGLRAFADEHGFKL
jgi:diadenosine tetraphosphatase ApaH/serine/threonine PP2A family protein phosphatase